MLRLLSVFTLLLAFALTALATQPLPAETGRQLIGTWYEHGDKDRPCSVKLKDHTLLATDHDRNASPLTVKSADTIYAVTWVQNAELLQDRILWSKGNWWSRKPVVYK